VHYNSLTLTAVVGHVQAGNFWLSKKMCAIYLYGTQICIVLERHN